MLKRATQKLNHRRLVNLQVRTIGHGDPEAQVGGKNFTGPTALEQIANVLKGKWRRTAKNNPFLGGFTAWRDPRRFKMPSSEEEWSRVDNYIIGYKQAAWNFHPTWNPKNQLRLTTIWPGSEMAAVVVFLYILYDQMTWDKRYIIYNEGLMVGPEYRAFSKLDETGFFDKYHAHHH